MFSQWFYALIVNMLELMFSFSISIKWSRYSNTGNTISFLLLSGTTILQAKTSVESLKTVLGFYDKIHH